MWLSISKIKKIYSILLSFDKEILFCFSNVLPFILWFHCMDFVFSHYYCYFLDISESIHLKIGWKPYETQCNGSNLICCLLVLPINSIHALANQGHWALFWILVQLIYICWALCLSTSRVRHNTTIVRVNFGDSLKNIPIPSNQFYLKCMIDKIESLIGRIRWKAHFLMVIILKIATFQTLILDLNHILHLHKKNILMHLKMTNMIWCDVLNLDVHVTYFRSN